MLKRKFYDTLLHWKSCHDKECLLVKGARQIGKTFIIDHFARENYQSYLYVNFITNPEYREIFEGSLEANDIFKKISFTFRDFQLLPGKTLLFLDEIQNCPKARTAFKPLAIDGRADVIGSGSLLGITFLNDSAELRKDRDEASIPVGYERQLTMHSLDLEEFLWSRGYDKQKIDMLREHFVALEPVEETINRKMHDLFREYIAVGGMPEIVNRFVETNSFSEVFAAQEKIVASNLDDIARFAATPDKPKIRACYLSIPNQLARENRKFKYSIVDSGGTARKFSSSIDWLRESGLILQCHNLETPMLPLSVYKQNDCFKIYLSDIGILTAMMGFEVKKAIIANTIGGNAKGGLYENALMSVLVRNGHNPFYYQPRSNQSEIDFLIEKDGSVSPIEVKASNNSSISFSRFLEREEVKVGYKFIAGNIGKAEKKITLPHYMAMFV